jgi:hypothetical protein
MRKGKATPAAAARADRSTELVCLALVLALVMLAARIVSVV